MRKRLLDTGEVSLQNGKQVKILRCDEDGNEFYQTDKNTVKWKS